MISKTTKQQIYTTIKKTLSDNAGEYHILETWRYIINQKLQPRIHILTTRELSRKFKHLKTQGVPINKRKLTIPKPIYEYGYIKTSRRNKL